MRATGGSIRDRVPSLALLSFLSLIAPAHPAEPRVPIAAPLEIKVPEPQVHVLSCGMKVLLLGDPSLPLVQGTLYLKGGTSSDPKGKEGLTSLVNAALRNGGAGKLSPEAFDEALEDKAISLSVSSDLETTTVGFQCLAGDLPEALALFSAMLREPRFEQKRLETSRALLLDAAARLEDTPDQLTRVLFRKAIFGEHPYGRWESPSTLSGLSPGDVQGHFRDAYGPEGSVLSLAGSFEGKAALASLEKAFQGWRRGAKAPVLGEPKALGPAVYFFPKEVSQVLVRLGYRGIARHDPDQFPLEVADHVWGGSGFTSRLMKELRSDRGLVYFVNSYSLPFDIPGIYQVVGGTRPDALEEYLTVLLRMAGDYAREGPGPAELAEAKRSMVEEFAGNFGSVFQVAAYQGNLAFQGYPEDYLATYREKIKAVGRSQAAQAVGKVLSRPDRVLVVCGPAELEKTLSKFGKVHVVKSVFDPLK
jgi:zinc protease